MRLILILLAVAGPVVFLSGEVSLIKVYIYEMFKIDHDIWDAVLPFFCYGRL